MKPKIKQTNCMWWCRGGNVSAYGYTPAWAYFNYLREGGLK